MHIKCCVAVKEEDIEKCMVIRRKVFVEEQNIPIQSEQDGLDKEAIHFLAFAEHEPVGTARVRMINTQTAKIERLAVLPEMRGSKLGYSLMEFILQTIKLRQEVRKITLSGQSYTVKFHERFGFRICSEEYLYAGIPHFDMILEL